MWSQKMPSSTTNFTLSEAEYACLLQKDFSHFIGRCFEEVAAGSTYLHNWHIDVIASKLEQCRRGEIRRLIINLPPRNMKSICASVAFTAWLLAHQPQSQIICVSYGQTLSEKHARDTRTILESCWYQTLFRTRLNARKSSLEEFMTTRGGTRIATSVGGVLTGRGADFIIIDDPLKPDQAISDSQRTNVNEWYDGTLYSRLNDKEKGCIIIIMQRLHEDDLVGHVLEQEGWEHLVLPAIAVAPETHRYRTWLGNHCVERAEGELLHPARESDNTLAQLRRSLGEYGFAGQYQQSPIPIGGGMIKKEWFGYYDIAPTKFDSICQSWDTASKAGEQNDYSVCTTLGVYQKQYYLLDVYRKRLEFPDLRRAVIDRQQRYNANTVLIEDKASGIQLIQDLRKQIHAHIVAISPENDKKSRMMAQTATLEDGRVLLPKEASWLTDFLHEMTVFPYGKFDDQADSVSQFLNWQWNRERACLPRVRAL
jgi:predicted phage terminase large subunit-like protein